MHIDDATFVVTDTETTGTHRGARIIELAAVKLQGGRLTDTFQELINPGQSVPGRITQITGITTGMVFDKPPAAEVVPDYLEFLGDDVLVAHNLSFDERMLNGELQRLGRPELANSTLCTLRLARRLLYELSSKGLTALLKHYGISMVDRHRALGDAEGTAEVLGRLLSHFRFARETSRLQDLLAFQYIRYRKTRSVQANVERIRRDVLEDVPRSPGVYFMTDEKGSPLYIGKAKNLKDRIQTYFTGLGAHQDRIKKLVEAVHDVSWRTTETELDALLDESALIKEHQPRYNRKGRRYRRRPFLRLGCDRGTVELSVTTRVRNDGADYFGPITPRRHALQLVELLSYLFGLEGGKIECEATPVLGRTVDVPTLAGSDERSAPRVKRLRAFLQGGDRTVIDRLEEAMYAASNELRFERARWFRDQVERLDRLFTSLRWMGGSLHTYDAVLLQPVEGNYRIRLFVISAGQVVHRCTVDRPIESARLKSLLRRYYTASPSDGRGYAKKEIEKIRIILHWLRNSEDDTTQVRWRPEEGLDGMMARIARCLGEQRAA